MAKPANELTPMQRQYNEIKEANQDCILFFRLGDFYEMFADDARIASRELDLTLTTRDKAKDKEDRTPMCGIPFHSSEGYIARLVSRGYKVAICEQLEDPALVKGLVKRDVVRIVTPGTVTESSMLDEKKNNYYACVAEQQLVVTDEVSAVESLGIATRLVQVGPNLKITLPGDLELAELIWQHRS